MEEYQELIAHYNKFNEDKRLTRRHGQVEYTTTMHYIQKYLEEVGRNKKQQEISILDIGAGTGRYAIPLSEEGYRVSAVELVPYNVGILKSKGSDVQAYQGSALRLKRFESESFHMVLLLGPMYHLFQEEEKVQALLEAKRVLKKDGVLLVAYLMNEYSILVHGFRDNYIESCMKSGQVDESFHVVNQPKDLYDYVRISDIERLNEKANLKRVQIVATTGAANYMRPVLREMNEKTFQIFLDYHFATCERMDLMGASSHTLDILRKEDL
ncbi:MAG: class I SAM-dependent methyltransferase [Eubacteriales bacterium]